ncbi:MAG: T9SS type A sorting domain-containing protein, partial [Fibromonadaceae bacterium]|nr:T9SS type A sorting domain-containing protein [Fibromonadaceae bacterium]
SLPTKDENGTSRSYTNQIEYYIIQDRGSYNSASQGTNSKKYGEATIDGIVYELYVADRINQPDLSGGNGNFKQYFSVPKSTSSHRSSGIISVYEHFKAWDKAGMKMLDCRLYEIAMKVESYTGSGSSDGSATVTKNLLTIGGSSTPSSNSGGGSSSSAGGGTYSSSARSSSSVSSGTQICGEYQTSFCGGMAYASVTGGSTTIPTTGGCLFIGDFEIIQPSLSSTIAINGVENTCGADWADCAYNSKPPTKDGGYYVYVKSGTVNSYQDNGWQGIIAKAKPSCTASSSSAAVSSSSSAISSSSSAGSSSSTQLSSSSAGGTTFALENRVPVTYFSMQSFSGKTLRIETSSPTVVEVFDLKGNKAASFNVLSTSETVKLSLPNGVYFAKVQGIKNIKFMLK